MPIVEGRAFRDSDTRRRAVGRDHQRDVRQAGVAGTVGVGRIFMQRTERRPRNGRSPIVGVARDAKYRYISSANAPFIYVPMSQQPIPVMEFYVRHAPGRQVAQEIRTAMAQVEPNVPIVMLQSFDDAAVARPAAAEARGVDRGQRRHDRRLPRRAGAVRVDGVPGRAAHAEIAIRMALGASHRDMRTMVLRQAGDARRDRRRDRPCCWPPASARSRKRCWSACRRSIRCRSGARRCSS